MKRSSNPALADLIVEWMKKELPKAGYEEIFTEQDGPMNALPNRKVFTIWKGHGKAKRECFKIEFAGLAFSTSDAYMRIFTSWGRTLEETASIMKDKVRFGKWNESAEVLAADPEFFQKMTLYMTRAAMVVTMGDFCPKLPEASNVAL